MKCRIKRSVVFLAITLSFLLMPVYAHSGRTDARGGHYNRRTGEYHYHHGYSAHDHYDMNHDGIIDCPYEFDDKTNHDSNNNDNITKPPSQKTAGNSEGNAFDADSLITIIIAVIFVGFWVVPSLFGKK